MRLPTAEVTAEGDSQGGSENSAQEQGEDDPQAGNGEMMDGIEDESMQPTQGSRKRRADSLPGASCTAVGPPKKARREAL